MATPDARSILRVPSRLCFSPANLSNDYPHGGTAMGVVARMAFKPGITTSEIIAEEFGNTSVEAVYCGENAVFACYLRGWDNDALQKMFPNTTLGASSGNRYARYEPGVSGQNRPGMTLSDLAVSLFVSPDSPDHHPGLLIYRAVPMLEETAELAFRSPAELGFPAVFRCCPDTSGRVYNMGWRKDLTL